jgi:plasmid stabilization system protein ParE
VDYHLLFTQRALDDLAEIIAYIAEDDLNAASRFGSSLLDHLDLLRRFPRMADTIRKRSQVRKLVHGPLLIYYQVHDDARLVEILHCRHGLRKLPRL